MAILEELTGIIKNHDAPDATLIKRHNIKLGLRNEDGSGVIVGITTKGTVTGYVKNADGKKVDAEGELYYCGHDIRDLVNAHTDDFGYEEIAFLLLAGSLPTASQLEAFTACLNERRALPVRFRNEMVHIINDSMMNSLQLAVTNLYGEDADPDSTRIEDVTRQSVDLIAKIPAVVAYAYHAMEYKYRGKDLTLVNPLETGSYAENFMHLLRSGDAFSPREAKLLDLFLILHAEHGGGNNSTFTVRTVSSSETDTYSAITAGMASLKGHLHGGANEQVMSMFAQIKQSVRDWRDKDEIAAYLRKVLRREAGDGSGKIYGLGHAVYTISDPRAILLKDIALDLAKEKGRAEEFALLINVADIGTRLLTELKPGKALAPNVDFYSGFVLDCMGIPAELYTPLFAAARVSGWCAHRLEQLVQNRLLRPAYFNASSKRAYIPMAGRG